MKVICNAAGYCSEEMCGAKEFHEYDSKECGHCPKNKYAECVEVTIGDGEVIDAEQI